MTLRTAATLLLLALALASTQARKLPSYIKLCKKDDPNYDACLTNTVETLRPRLLKGIPKIHVPPIDPFVLPALEVRRDQEAVKVRALLKNIVATGAKDFVINRLKTDTDKLAMEGSLTFPLLHVTSDYDVDGRIIIPFKGKGAFTGNFTGVKVDMKGDGRLIKKNGEDFFQIKSLKAKIKVDDASVKINEGSDRNGALAQSAIQFYNQNKKQILQIIMPIVQETAEEVVMQIGNRILGTVPASELLPE